MLADSERIHQWAWNKTLEPLGIQLDWEFYLKNFVGVADEVALRDRLGIDDRDGLVARKQAFFRQGLSESQPFSAETVQLLKDVCLLYRLAVVSSSYRSEVEPPLVRGGIRPLFELLICGEDVRNFKPSPEPYLLAAERLGVRRPLVIEDSDSGVAAGRAAGFEVLRVSGAQKTAEEVRAHLANRRGVTSA